MFELPHSIEAWLPVVLGALLLFFGRRLFWLCLAVLGFFFTFGLVSELTDQTSQSLAFFLALGLGVVGALLAVFLQKIAIGVAGFLFGGAATLFLIDFFALPVGPLEWVLVLVGAVVSAFLAFKIFTVALVVLSSLVGAALISQAIGLSPSAAGIFFVVLAIVGIVAQLGSKARRRKRREAKA
ncbi:MAG: DUF4203 domain-containing protein [Acidobacteria bacterium]|nr:DUF4203 domain-containing protein [Acidobacteriota bacterium]